MSHSSRNTCTYICLRKWREESKWEENLVQNSVAWKLRRRCKSLEELWNVALFVLLDYFVVGRFLQKKDARRDRTTPRRRRPAGVSVTLSGSSVNSEQRSRDVPDVRALSNAREGANCKRIRGLSSSGQKRLEIDTCV